MPYTPVRRYELYGPRITVVRKVTAAGGGSYALLDAAGRRVRPGPGASRCN